MDITLDDVLAILDEHYNNVKALDALNQELFQLWMVQTKKLYQTGVSVCQDISRFCLLPFLTTFPPHQVAELKRDHFYGRLPKPLKVMVAYLKAGLQVRTCSDYLRATQEAEKEDFMELIQGPGPQDN